MKSKSIPSVKAKISGPSRAKNAVPPSTLFTLYAPGAREVFLLGEFNGWQMYDLKARRCKDGTWRKSVPLKAGTYQYLFWVDGEWWSDPANPKRVQNPYGTENSVVDVC